MYTSQRSVETVGQFQITLQRAIWPDRQWYYEVVDGYQVSVGGPYPTKNDAREAANKVIAGMRGILQQGG